MNKPALREEAFKAIFSGVDSFSHGGRTYRVKTNKRKKLRYVEYGGGMLLEQNPKTGSMYADMARRGHKVVWFIHKEDGYTGLIIDGEVHGREDGTWVERKTLRFRP